jgi:hypothetical protein
VEAFSRAEDSKVHRVAHHRYAALLGERVSSQSELTLSLPGCLPASAYAYIVMRRAKNIVSSSRVNTVTHEMLLYTE